MYVGQPLVGRVLWMLLCLWTAAPLDAAQFQLAVGSTGKTAGVAVTVPIVVTTEAAVGAAQWELLYDPATLRWAGGSEGSLAVGTLIDANVIEPGRAKIAFAGGDGIKGTGDIYRAEFEWIGKPLEPTGIRFANVRAWEQSGGLELTTSAAAGNASPPSAAGVPPDSHVEKDVPAVNSPDKSRYLYIAALVLLLGAALATLLRKSSKR
jgi:hypothetical protein